MRGGQETFRPPGGALPLVPPPEADELISSRLGRTARLYGQPVQELLHRAGRPSRPVDLSAVDLGAPRSALGPVASLLGIDVGHLAAHTIAAACPWAVGLAARGAPAPWHRRGAVLRYAACPHCLEQQRLERGVSWLRRAWVLAPRTVCSAHGVPLVAVRPGAAAHPVWSDFLRRHRQACVEAAAAAPPWQLPTGHEGEAVLHREMATVQDAILADASRGQRRVLLAGEGKAAFVRDLTWAFTRADRHYPDRLVYEAFASDLLDNPRTVVRRRRPGPVDLVALPLEERHLLMATATVLSGPADLRRMFYPPPSAWTDDLATVARRLRDDDRVAFRDRQEHWPDHP